MKLYWASFLAISLLFSGVFETRAIAVERVALVPSTRQNESLSDLEWLVTDPPVTVIQEKGSTHLQVRLVGKFDRQEWSLIKNKKTLKESGEKSGTFFADVILDGVVTPVLLIAIGPRGETQTDRLDIQFPSYATTLEEAKKGLAASSSIFASLGITSLNYQETRRPDFSAFSTTAKMSYLTPISSPLWDLGINFFITAFSLQSNISGVTARAVGANFRAGYVIPTIREPWKVSILAGVSYSSLIFSGAIAGYKGLLYPQFFPNARRTLSDHEWLGFYLKYVPLSANAFSLSLSERELAMGMSYTWLNEKSHPVSYSFDYSDIGFEPTQNYKIHSGSLTFSAGYGF